MSIVASFERFALDNARKGSAVVVRAMKAPADSIKWATFNSQTTATKAAPDVDPALQEVISSSASGVQSSPVTQKGTTSALIVAGLSSQATGGQAAYDKVSVMEGEGKLPFLTLDFSETVISGGFREAAPFSYLRMCSFHEAALLSHQTGVQSTYYLVSRMEQMFPSLASNSSKYVTSGGFGKAARFSHLTGGQSTYYLFSGMEEMFPSLASNLSKDVISGGFDKAARFSHLAGGQSTYDLVSGMEEMFPSLASNLSKYVISGGFDKAARFSHLTGGQSTYDLVSGMEEMFPPLASNLSKYVNSGGFGKSARFSHLTGREILLGYSHPSSVRFLSSAAELAKRQAGGEATPAAAAATCETTSRSISMSLKASIGVEFANGATRAQAPCAIPKSQSRWNGWPLRFVVSVPITVTIMVGYEIGDEDKERMTVEGQENLQGPEVAQLTAPLEEQRRVKTTHPSTDSAEEDEDENENEEETRTNNATDSGVKKPKLLQALGWILLPKYKADEGKSRF